MGHIDVPSSTVGSTKSGNQYIGVYQAGSPGGTSFTKPLAIQPPAGSSFPSAAPIAVMAGGSDSNGPEFFAATLGSSSTSQVNLTVTISAPPGNNLGNNLVITVVLTYGSGDGE